MKKKLGMGLALSVLPLAACTGPDTDNRYEVIAVVDEVHEESFHITDITIVDAHGDARERLANGEDIHDNYRDLACIGNETSNDFDELKESGRLVVGSVVRVEATVGESKAACVAGSKGGYYQDRSILEELEVIEP